MLGITHMPPRKNASPVVAESNPQCYWAFLFTPDDTQSWWQRLRRKWAVGLPFVHANRTKRSTQSNSSLEAWEESPDTPLQRSICTVSKCFNDFASFGIFMTFHDHFLPTLPWPRLRNALRGLRKPGAHSIGSKSRFHLCLSETMKHPPHRCTCGFDMTFVCSYQTGNKKTRDGDGTVFEVLRKGTAREKGFRDLSSILLYRQERNCCNLYKIDLYLTGYLTLAKVHCSEGQVMKLHPLSLSQRCRQTGQRFQLCFFINSRMAGSIRFSSASSQLSRWDGWVHAAQKLCLHWGQFTLAARCSCTQPGMCNHDLPNKKLLHI